MSPSQSNMSLEFYLAAGLTCARRVFEQLDKHWDGPENGMNRLHMTDRETEGLDILTREAQSMGMQAYELLSGSRMFIYPGEDPTLPPEVIGSHIDSVKKGGRYDGPAGIILGLGAVAAIHDRFLETGVRPKRTIVVLADRGEESTEYNQFGIASGMNAGKFGPEILDLVSVTNGKTWAENARTQGLDVDALREKLTTHEKLIPFEFINSQWEAHIEQGKKLAKANVSLGIVSGFRGNVRFAGTVQFTGRADHTGATEMEDRLDAGRALMNFLHQVDSGAQKLREGGLDLVYTYHFKTDDNRTAIPENASAAVEARSTSPEALRLFEIIVECAAQAQAAKGFGVNMNQDKMKRTAPVQLDDDCQKIIAEAAANLNVTTMPMNSGAGHDLMNYAPYVRAGFILFGHGNDGVSHNPGEILGLTEQQDPFVDGNYPKAMNVITHILTRDERMPANAEQGDVSRVDFAAELVKRGAKPLTLTV